MKETKPNQGIDFTAIFFGGVLIAVFGLFAFCKITEKSPGSYKTLYVTIGDTKVAPSPGERKSPKDVKLPTLQYIEPPQQYVDTTPPPKIIPMEEEPPTYIPESSPSPSANEIFAKPRQELEEDMGMRLEDVEMSVYKNRMERVFDKKIPW